MQLSLMREEQTMKGKTQRQEAKALETQKVSDYQNKTQ